MKIIDNTQQNISPKEMKSGVVYKIILEGYDDTDECIVMKAGDCNCEGDYIPLVDLCDGTYFQVGYNEFAQIKQVNAKLVID